MSDLSSSQRRNPPMPYRDYIPHVFRGIHFRNFDNQNRIVLPKAFFRQHDFKYFYSYYVKEFDHIFFIPLEINEFCRIGEISDDSSIAKIAYILSSVHMFEGEINYVRGKNRVTINDYMVSRCSLGEDVCILGQGPIFTITHSEKAAHTDRFVLTR